MGVIAHDPRHHSLQIFEDRDVSKRYFDGWSLAYAGPSTYVDRKARMLFQTDIAVAERMRAELLDLFQDFTTFI